MKLMPLVVLALLLSGCGGPALTGDGDAKGGDVKIPITVHKTDYGSACHTPYGSCIMFQPGVVGTVCTCVFPGGSALGKISQ